MWMRKPHMRWFYIDRGHCIRGLLTIIVTGILLSTLLMGNRSDTERAEPVRGQVSVSDDIDLFVLKAKIKSSRPRENELGLNVDEFLINVEKEHQIWNPEQVPEDISSDSSMKYILYWNEAYGSTEYGFCCGQQPLENYHCPNRNCYFTNNRSLFGTEEQVTKFDAILFHQRSLVDDDLPVKRSPRQRYIMFMIESAHYPMGFDSEIWGGFFNWTMTYRQDSTIPFPYGEIVPSESKPLPRPDRSSELEAWIREFGATHKQLAQGKPNKIAWFVSNCETQSNREKFATALSNHIQIDVFGQCGPKRCGRESGENCWKMVEREYKFYLAFENSICTDYVTEKFFNSMSYHIIPIVLGGANYSGIAPMKSYISVNDFDSHPGRLARHLQTLDNNDDLYAEYFWWKDFYNIKSSEEDRAKSFCDICQKLHDPNEAPSVYDDLEEWWNHKAKCRRVRVKL